VPGLRLSAPVSVWTTHAPPSVPRDPDSFDVRHLARQISLVATASRKLHRAINDLRQSPFDSISPHAIY
jgi:hypothetical protein